MARNDRWGRTYESFGETRSCRADGHDHRRAAGHALGDPTSVLATAKHYLGDGGTTGGVDQGDAQISEAELRAIHLPPFIEAVDRGVGSVMVSFSSWNGAKLHGHQYLLTGVLKGELGFDGIRGLRLGRHRPDRRRGGGRSARRASARVRSTPASTW